MSPDTNFVFGGSPSGYDIFVGVRNATGPASLTNGLYNEIGLDEDASQYASDQTANIDTYYGVFNAVSGQDSLRAPAYNMPSDTSACSTRVLRPKASPTPPTT